MLYIDHMEVIHAFVVLVDNKRETSFLVLGNLKLIIEEHGILNL
jgi:hypothetical protein